MSCASSCKTQDHATYGQCMRAKGVAVMGLESTGQDFTRQKHWDRELQAYRDAVAEGLNPEGTTYKEIDAAKKAADLAGEPVAQTA